MSKRHHSLDFNRIECLFNEIFDVLLPVSFKLGIDKEKITLTDGPSYHSLYKIQGQRRKND